MWRSLLLSLPLIPSISSIVHLETKCYVKLPILFSSTYNNWVRSLGFLSVQPYLSHLSVHNKPYTSMFLCGRFIYGFLILPVTPWSRCAYHLAEHHFGCLHTGICYFRFRKAFINSFSKGTSFDVTNWGKSAAIIGGMACVICQSGEDGRSHIQSI